MENRLDHKGASKVPLVLLLLWIFSTLFWWGLAFYPTSAPVEWLEAARAVCFGTAKTGLPDSSGWLLLIGAPLFILAALIVASFQELQTSSAIFFKNKLGQIILATIAIVILVEVRWTAVKVRDGYAIASRDYSSPDKGQLPEDYPQVSEAVPSFMLFNQFGNAITDKSFIGKPVLMTFAFAHCQTVCPTLVAQAVVALKRFKQEELNLLIITLDPWRDTPRSLPSLAKKWSLPGNAHVLSGEIAQVNEVLTKFQVATKRNENDGDIVHPALTYVLDKSGRIAFKFNNASPEWLEQAVQKLISQTVSKN